jgi:hypothetical protein
MDQEKRYQDHDLKPVLDQFRPYSKTGVRPCFLSRDSLLLTTDSLLSIALIYEFFKILKTNSIKNH